MRLGTLLQTTAAILGCAWLGAISDAGAVYPATTAVPVKHPALATMYSGRKGHQHLRSDRGGHPHHSCRPISHGSSPYKRNSYKRKLRPGCQVGARGAHPKSTHRRRPAAAPGALTAPNAAARARASTIAKVLSSPCQNTELMPEPGNLGLIRAAVLCLINRERAENGETPLKLNGQLEDGAETHSQEMVSADYFAHVSPSGLTPVGRARSTGYIPGPSVGYVIGENIAWGTFDLATPQAIVAAWIASPEHLANILEGHYRETGIGVAPAVPSAFAHDAPGATYSQEFGVTFR